MSEERAYLRELRVDPGKRARLAERDPGARIGAPGKKEGVERLEALVEQLSMLHNRLYGEGTRALLLVLQGMDASGKDGTIRSVLTGLNPQGCRIQSFKVPTTTELNLTASFLSSGTTTSVSYDPNVPSWFSRTTTFT